MRFAVPPDLSAFIAARIANYSVEATEQYHTWEVPAVAEFVALPLIRHWHETYGLRADGELVRWHTDGDDPYPGVRPVEDREGWLSALVEGALRWSELRALLPARPPEALDCRCIGWPLFGPGKAICPLCCGLRWVLASDLEPGARNEAEKARDEAKKRAVDAKALLKELEARLQHAPGAKSRNGSAGK